MDVFDLVVKDGTLITSDGPKRGHVAIKNGKIAALLSDSQSAPESLKTVNAQGLHLFPGCIDSQVHFREPGLTHKETIESGTRSAALGGITSIFEMPNTKPSTTTAELFQQKMDIAKRTSWVNYAFYVGASKENTEDLAHLEVLPGCSGIKVFMGSSTGSLLVDDDASVENVLRSGRRRVIFHSEDEDILKSRKHLAEESQSVLDHPKWRDESTAIQSTQRLLRLAFKTKRPIHVLHVSTYQEMELLKKAKAQALAEGLGPRFITVEVLPQHLHFAAPEAYQKLGTKAQQNPPIRSAEHRDGLWRAIHSGVVDVIGSDHAPHTLEEKSKPYPQSPSGMPMVQTLLPLLLHFQSQGKMSLEQILKFLCRNPSEIFGRINKGRWEIGIDADLTLVDLKCKKKVERSWIASKSGWSPLEGETLMGWPTHTIVSGRCVMNEGTLESDPSQVLGQGLAKEVLFFD